MSSEPREYLIRKGGYYYRPNCSGYTTSKFEAGRYTKAEAEREAAVEPWHMSAIHQDDVEDDPVSSRIRMDTARIEALEAENVLQHREFMEAIDYAADIAGIEADTFIRVWREGGCEEQSDEHNEWGDFREWRAARRAREGGNADG